MPGLRAFLVDYAAPLGAIWGGGFLLFSLLAGGGRRRRQVPIRDNPRPRPRPAPPRRKKRAPSPAARELEAIERDTEACESGAACYEDRRDRRGRRRRCRETFKNKREAVEALDDALDGMLTRYLERTDDGSPVLRDLEEATEDRRGRRRRLRTWWDAAAWAAPSSRRWRDFDPRRLETISEALRHHLTTGGGAEPLPLALPLPSQRLAEADQRREQCRLDGEDRAAEARARRKARRQLPALADVPF